MLEEGELLRQVNIVFQSWFKVYDMYVTEVFGVTKSRGRAENSLDGTDGAKMHAHGRFVDNFDVRPLFRTSVDARIHQTSKFV